MKDCFLPAPFGCHEPSIVLEGRHFRDEGIAIVFLRDRGFTRQEAVAYVQLLIDEYMQRRTR